VVVAVVVTRENLRVQVETVVAVLEAVMVAPERLAQPIREAVAVVMVEPQQAQQAVQV
jgi:hypothetical protein